MSDSKLTSRQYKHIPLTITHNIYTEHIGITHSLTVNGEESREVGFKDIARNGNFCAVTEYHKDVFPEIFMITNFSNGAITSISRDGTVKKTTKVI